MGVKVDIYWNLHKRVFSVRAVDGRHKGRVVAHCHDIVLKDVSFLVDNAGRQRVLRSRRKNVHAFVRGTILRAYGKPKAGVSVPGLRDDGQEKQSVRMPSGSRPVSYNPYKGPSFFLKDTNDDINTAEIVRAIAAKGRARVSAVRAAQQDQ